MKHAPRQSAAAAVAAGAAGTAADAAVVAAAVGVAATEAVAGAAAIAATVEIAGNNKKRSESESVAPQLRSGCLNPSLERENPQWHLCVNHSRCGSRSEEHTSELQSP